MDPVSQGALGAIAGACFARRESLRKAAAIGWAAGMLPDADILISSETDPLLNIEYHRHFSHALIFIPVGALLCAAAVWLLTRRWWRLPFRQVYWFSLAGFATAGLLDACTSYGTRLFWPFSDERVAWNIISIVDPVFTGVMLLALAIAILRKRPGWTRAALAFVSAYLVLGVVQRERTLDLQRQLAGERGHNPLERPTVKPSIGNQVLWRSIYQHGDRYYIDAIRTSLLGRPRFYEGVSVPVLTLEALQDGLPPESVLAGDLERFARFSDGYLAWHPERAGVVGDLRYAALPQSVRPLWGIRVDPEKPDEHVPFEGFRAVDADERTQLLRMLKGEALRSGR
ncbi:MAG: metal-dependent hydrolase [Akkermansiaceae bacterium]|nr:metal-dependent hydrolase [Akkermansiaceae bacterium]NNM28330.1 metal-dependent hydrolase [Akkermansiaceae bacterium]